MKIFLRALITIFSALLFVGFSNAQNVAINNNGDAANNSAMLDISSTTKGLLIPRMRTIERTSIVTPADGLLVYDIDTKGFWYYSSNSWNELPKSNGGGGTPSGPASGDLSGNYPSPNVAKIQNLDVAFGVPFDKQILKWDMLNNRWKGENDSLFLPYNSTFGSPAKLFGITNTNTSNGATAIYGKSGNTGSGINPGALTIGVWGDNSTGPGVMGTSSNHVGTYGYSVNNHGTYGFTGGVGFAGVYGGRVNNGPAVMGEIYSAGISMYGKSNGTSGKAALFETVHTSNTDTVVKSLNKGLGVNSYFINDNTSNTGALINGEHFGQGAGVYMKLWNAQNNNPGFYVYQYGNGDGLYVGSNKSKVARFYSNAGNTDTAVTITQDGSGRGLMVKTTTGKTADFTLSNAAANEKVLMASNYGNDTTSFFRSLNATNYSPVVAVEHNGTGQGLFVNLKNASNNLAAVEVVTKGNRGIEVISDGIKGIVCLAKANNAIGINGYTDLDASYAIGVYGESGLNGTNGIGVKGEAGLNDVTGIGVLGISNSTGTDRGAVTGINNETGIGVYGQSGGNDGVAVYGLAGQSGTLTKAAIFKNTGTSNNRTVVEISNAGTGHTMFVNNTNASGNTDVLRVRNNSNGNFLLFENGILDPVMTVSKAGNIKTDGTITVKTDKGIIRNSTSTQMVYKIVPVTVTLPYNINSSLTYVADVSFSGFSNKPVISIGDFTASTGGLHQGAITIHSVTSTSCQVYFHNNSSYNWTANSSATFNLVMIGPE